MSRRKQSTEDRLRRMNDGRCPIHGTAMGQVDGWYYPEGEKPYTIEGCGRRDCHVRVKAYSYDGPRELMPEWAHLLKEGE